MLEDACAGRKHDDVQRAHANMLYVFEKWSVYEKMKAFDQANDQIPEFKVFRSYMRMVMEMMVFITAVRTGNWELHLKAIEVFTKYLFAHDRLNYERMITLYLAEMKSLQSSDTEIYDEFLKGKWIVNKNEQVSFCALGADHAKCIIF